MTCSETAPAAAGICLITGRSGSGKTSLLVDYINSLGSSGRSLIGGVLSLSHPGKDHRSYRILQLSDGVSYDLSSSDPAEPCLQIGPHRLSESALARACTRIIKDLADFQFIVLDEVGILELSGQGLSSAVHACLQSSRHLIFTVRTANLDRFSSLLKSYPLRSFTMQAIAGSIEAAGQINSFIKSA
ncbi:MAG: nucleoside-triphosphatase [Candidatus Wallbacteria bacterium]|nr:nucleoside-triphosphatase [Candidatus Wallbacteria bacterium]